MPQTDSAQIYLITPLRFDPGDFGVQLAEVLDSRDIACLRIATAGQDLDRVTRAADHLRQICHARDVACVVEDHDKLVVPLGLDGVHLSDGSRRVREVRKSLGQDRIVGAFCENSRHAGMTAGEIGVDYVSFGPVSGNGGLGSDRLADTELFRWWAEMIEVPVVAEGRLTRDSVDALSPYVDFFAVGDEIWDAEHGTAAAALNALIPRE